MLKYCLLFIGLAFSFSIVDAQSANIDSLQKTISNTKKDSNTIKSLILLAEHYRWEKPDSGIYYAQKVLSLNKEWNFSTRYNAFAWNSIGYARYMKADYTGAAEAFQQYYNYSKQANDKINMGFALNNEGNIYIELGDYAKALDKYKEALKVREDAKDIPGIAMSYNNIGFIYKDIGDYEKAISNFLFSLREYEKLKDKKAIAKTHGFIGIVYAKKGETAKAIEHYEKAIDIQKSEKDNNELAISYQTLATVYKEQKEYHKAKELLLLADAIFKSTGDKRQIAMLEDDLGDLFYEQSLYDSARYHYQQSILLNEQIRNKRNISSALLGLAKTSLKQKDFVVAKRSLDSANSVLVSTNKKDELKEYFLITSDYYAATGNQSEAYNFYKKYSDIKDTLLNESNVKAIADMEVKYETEKKQQEILLQQSEIKRKNVVLWAAAGLFLLSMLLGYSFYRRYRLKQKAKLQQEIMKQQEIATKAVIEAEEEERKRIARDLHDGVGQMMSAAKMNLSAFESEISFTNTEQKLSFKKIIDLVDESCKEVRSVSHNMMPNALLKSSLSSAVKDFIDKLDQKTIKVHLFTEGLDQRLDSNVETVLYRVIQECVNNVIKHSGANTLDISVIKDEEGISATIEDNGKGFNTNDKKNFDGIGMKNILTRVEYLKGTVDFDSTPGKGTLVAVHVPLNAR